jgi:hypothetical protein
MANPIKWSTPSTTTTIINGDATAPTLKNLLNNGQKLGVEVNNESNKDQYASFELSWRAAATPAVNAIVELYIITAMDGTNYSDGDDTIAPSYTSLVGGFNVRLVTTQQRCPAIINIPIPPFKFKLLVINKTGQSSTNTDNENVLRMRTYNQEI